MPLVVNVGLSRKASRNYQSCGASINLTAELDPALLGQPDELQRQIDRLYVQARKAVDRQTGGGEPGPGPGPRTGGEGHYTGGRNGHGPYTGPDRPMTVHQRRAIDAICRRVECEPAEEAQSALGCGLDDLTVRQASSLIDHLQRLERSIAISRNASE